MNCRNCGAVIADNAAVCPYCNTKYGAAPNQGFQNQGFQNQGVQNQPYQAGNQPAPFSNPLPLAIFVTICCCIPLGIVSILKANKANQLAQMGDMAGATAAAGEAKTWAIVGIIIGLITNTISFFCNFASALADEL